MSTTKKEIGFYTGILLVPAGKKEKMLEVLEETRKGFHDAYGTTGRIHFARFIFLDEGHLAYFIDYDSVGDQDEILTMLAERAGPHYDKILQLVKNRPPTPVAQNVPQFIQYLNKITVDVGLTGYSYQHTVREIWDAWEIKSQPSESETFQTGLNSVMQPKTCLTFHLVNLSMKLMRKQMLGALYSVRTVHAVRFFSLKSRHKSGKIHPEDIRICLFTSYDFGFHTYVLDFVIKVGWLFDLLMQWVVNDMPTYGKPPKTNVQKDSEKFIEFVHGSEPAEKDTFYYSAYPNISVEQIWYKFGEPEKLKVGFFGKLKAFIMDKLGELLPYWQGQLKRLFGGSKKKHSEKS